MVKYNFLIVNDQLPDMTTLNWIMAAVLAPRQQKKLNIGSYRYTDSS